MAINARIGPIFTAHALWIATQKRLLDVSVQLA